MDCVFVPECKIPIVGKVDVFIAGGGCAGTGAAIAAARNGLKVLVAERMFYLGGNMTGGLMGKICIGPRQHGIAEELLVRLDKHQGTNFVAGRNFIPEDPAFLPSRTQIPIDPEITKFVLEKMVIDESGAEVLYGTGISSVLRKGNNIKHVIIDSLNGLEAVEAKYFIDCTGDGQLAFKAGAEYVTGSDNGYSSSPTLMFRVGNVNIEKLIAEMEAHQEDYTSEQPSFPHHRLSPGQNRENVVNERYAHFADFIPLFRKKVNETPGMFNDWEIEMMLQRGILFMNQPQKGHVLVNCTRIPHFKGNDNKELTNAFLSGRKQAEAVFRFMKNFLPGFENSFIMDTASLLGIRESRRIIGDYIFTEKDVLSKARFDDVVATNHEGLEIHGAGNGKGTNIQELKFDEYYHVPYRSIIAKGFDNLFMAGRCFSASHAALSAARNITYCMSLGQASGMAVAQLVKLGKLNTREIDIKALQKNLVSII